MYHFVYKPNNAAGMDSLGQAAVGVSGEHPGKSCCTGPFAALTMFGMISLPYLSIKGRARSGIVASAKRCGTGFKI